MVTKVVADGLQEQIERLGRSTRKKLAAIAYVSAPIVAFRDGDILVTDASLGAITTGQTSASVLLRAARAGAKVYSVPKLHAKVLVVGKTAVIGSANLSLSSRRLREAAVFTTDGSLVRQAGRFVSSLAREVSALSVSDLRKLCSVPVDRSNSSHGGMSAKPSLLYALLNDSLLLDSLVFGWYYIGGQFNKTEVTRAAKKRKVPLPGNGRWCWYESPLVRGSITRTRQLCDGRALVSWETDWNKDSNSITCFREHDNSARHFIDVFALDGVLVTIYSSASARVPVDLQRDRRKLAESMTSGFKKAPPKLQRSILNAEDGLMTTLQVRKLLSFA